MDIVCPLAGILEEVAYSLEHNKPTLVLGGCSRLIADFLADEGVSWPNELALEASENAERDARLTTEEKLLLSYRFNKTKERMAGFRTSIWHNEKTIGIESKLIQESLRDDNARRVINRSAAIATDTELDLLRRID